MKKLLIVILILLLFSCYSDQVKLTFFSNRIVITYYASPKYPENWKKFRQIEAFYIEEYNLDETTEIFSMTNSFFASSYVIKRK